MIQLTETEKNNVVWPENSAHKSYKIGNITLIFGTFEFHFLIFRYLLYMVRGHNISKGQKNLLKNKHFTAISKKG